MKKVIEFIKLRTIGRIIINADLKKYTTYKVGGKAKIICFPRNVYKLSVLLKYLKDKNIKFMILGNGSNVIFSDKDYDGVIIKLDDIDDLKIKDTTVTVGAGYPLQKLAMLTARKSLSGLEFAAGIPGSIGGAIYMNAGAYNSDMGYIVSKIKVINKEGHISTIYNRNLDFHYRTSMLQKNKDLFCIEATIILKKGDKDALLSVIEDRKQRRLMSQPLDYPTAGSVFRNPEDNFAGKLIEDAGLKGMQLGGAMVSMKHANFIINYDNATANDIKNLIELIQKEVKKKYNIELKCEQEYINW